MARSTDASIAFSVTDNLSESVVKMKNAITSTKQDAEQLQKTLDLLTNTKMQLKNVDLKNTQAELARTKKAFEELGESATEAEREAARADFEQANRNYENVRGQLEMVSKRARQTTKDLLDATGAISKADNRAETSGSVVCCPPWEGLACWKWRGIRPERGPTSWWGPPWAVRRAPCSPAP